MAVASMISGRTAHELFSFVKDYTGVTFMFLPDHQFDLFMYLRTPTDHGYKELRRDQRFIRGDHKITVMKAPRDYDQFTQMLAGVEIKTICFANGWADRLPKDRRVDALSFLMSRNRG